MTLFLSIEASKAMTEVSQAEATRDEKGADFAQRKVNCFTNQLNESNSILTDISDAMTEEGECKEQWAFYTQLGEIEAAEKWERRMKEAREKKASGSLRLLEVSSKYMTLMTSIREELNC